MIRLPVRSPGSARPWRAALLAVLAAVSLSACDDARRLLGKDKAPPDEFKIVSRAPLSLPPDYALRPPQPGAPRPQETSTGEAARNALLAGSGVTPAPRTPVDSAAPPSPGESALLAAAGASRSDPTIREVVDRESLQLVEADQTLLDKLIFWRKPDEPGTVVDPQRESQRLRENAAMGRPAGEGDTPSIKRRKRAPLEGLF
jgi:hypothetical protein